MKIKDLHSDIKYGNLSATEFYDKFIDYGRGDQTIFDRLKFLNFNYHSIEDERIAYAETSGKIIGIAGIQQSPYEEETLWIKYISVDESFRNKGIAKHLLRMLYEYASRNNKKLYRSTPTEDGKKYLSSVHKKLSKEFPDRLTNKE